MGRPIHRIPHSAADEAVLLHVLSGLPVVILNFIGVGRIIELVQSDYLNNSVKQITRHRLLPTETGFFQS